MAPRGSFNTAFWVPPGTVLLEATFTAETKPWARQAAALSFVPATSRPAVGGPRNRPDTHPVGGAFSGGPNTAEGEGAWLPRGKPGWPRGGGPCSRQEDEEASGRRPGSCGPSCPTSPHTPTHVWVPRQGTRSCSFVLGPGEPSNALQSGSWGSCSDQGSGFFSNPQRSGEPCRSASAVMVLLHSLCTSLSPLSTLPVPSAHWDGKVGRWQAGPKTWGWGWRWELPVPLARLLRRVAEQTTMGYVLSDTVLTRVTPSLVHILSLLSPPPLCSCHECSSGGLGPPGLPSSHHPWTQTPGPRPTWAASEAWGTSDSPHFHLSPGPAPLCLSPLPPASVFFADPVWQMGTHFAQHL